MSYRLFIFPNFIHFRHYKPSVFMLIQYIFHANKKVENENIYLKRVKYSALAQLNIDMTVSEL